MQPTKGRVVFVTLESGDEVPAVVRHASDLEVCDVTALPDYGEAVVRLAGLPHDEAGHALTWRWPPRVP